jgi:hypothetical protein
MSRSILAILLIALATGGCATVKVYPASPSDKPKGARVYPPKVYLLVDESASELVTIPDLCRPYDLAPLTILAKQDFTVEAREGQLEALTANQDTIALLTFLGGVAELGAKAVGAGVSSKKLAGSFGLKPGVYEFADDGTLRAPQKCTGWAE